MLSQINSLLDEYTAWLRTKTNLRQIEDWVEITTPYLDRHNDYLQIYVKREDNGFILTDDGFVLSDLKSSGCNIESDNRQALLTLTLNGFGVHLSGDALEVSSSIKDFALKKHNLVQAMLAVNDLFFLASPFVSSLFLEDVMEWLDASDIRYITNAKFSGTSGYDHRFDFVIPQSKSQPERMLRSINRPNRDRAQSVAFAWIDTKDTRPSDSRAYAFLNDVDHTIPSNSISAMKSYGVRPVPWSEREHVLEELVA